MLICVHHVFSDIHPGYIPLGERERNKIRSNRKVVALVLAVEVVAAVATEVPLDGIVNSSRQFVYLLCMETAYLGNFYGLVDCLSISCVNLN